MTDDIQAALRTAYEQLCISYHMISDFRAKLLGLLPLVSGTGIFLLLNKGSLGLESIKIVKPHLGPIGVFGFFITLGLFCYELRGIQRCNALIAIGKDIETRLGVAAQFRLRPGSVGGVIDATLAGRIVYSAVLAAWAFLAWQGTGNPPLAEAGAVAVFLIVFIGSFFLRNLKVNLRELMAKLEVVES